MLGDIGPVVFKSVTMSAQLSVIAIERLVCTHIEFSLNVFTEFSDKNICHYSKRA